MKERWHDDIAGRRVGGRQGGRFQGFPAMAPFEKRKREEEEDEETHNSIHLAALLGLTQAVPYVRNQIHQLHSVYERGSNWHAIYV